MSHTLQMTKKAFTAAVVAATIAWSISLSAFLAPLTAKAAASGSLVKASLPAVYYVGADGKRYVFPNEKTYKTWYADFSTVITITDAELASMAIGGNVTYRPGVKMVKITTDPKVYAVDNGGVLRWVKSEAIAVALYGATWNQQIHDVPDAFFTNYTVGADINSSSDFNPAAETAAATSINVDKGLGSGAVAGSVSVMLASGQPAGGTLPKGAMGVNFIKFDVRNGGSSAATVSSITVKRSGPGATTDFSNLYVYQGANRLTTGRTLNSSTNDATFSGLNLVVAAGATASLWVAADISSTGGAGNVNALEITSVMVGGASAVGTPISGPSFTLASATVGTTTVDQTGTLTAVKAGGMSQKVAEFRLTAPSTEDADFKSIAIFYAGTANRSDVSNLSLKQAGLTLATTSSITDKDLAVFLLSSPMYLEKGAQRTFEVYADIGGNARATENVAFQLDQTTDLVVIGRTYGFGTMITNNWTTGNTASIEAGKLTTTFNGPAAKDVARNGKDVELFNFTMAAQSNLEVRQTDLVVTVAAAADCNLIDDLKIVDTATGAIIAGPKDLANVGGTATTCEVTGGTNDTTEFTETWSMSAGQTRTFKVTADIDNTFTANNTIKVQLGDGTDLFDASKVRNLDNSTYLAVANGDFVPSTPIVGNTHTVKAPSLTTSAASTPVAQTYIQGTQGVELAGISLKAGDAGAVKVTTVKFTGFIDNDGDGATSAGQQGCDTGCLNTVAGVAQTLKLWNGSTQVGDTETPTASTAAGSGGTVTFDNLNLTIAAGQTVALKVTANLAGGLSNLSDDIYLNIAAATDVTATDADGGSLTPTGTTAGPQMIVAASGAITAILAPDDTESEAGNLVGGASNIILAKYKFTAQNEELKLTKARLFVASASATAVSSLSLYDGATLVGGPVSVDSSGVADFSSANFVIPKDASKTLTVKGNLSSVGSSGATSGLDAKVTLDFDTNFEVRGTGAGSSTQLTSVGAADIVGRSKIVRKTKPTVSLVSLPTTALNDGTMVLSRFTVSADSAGDVSIKRISFSSTKTSALGITAANIREVGQGSDIAGATTLAGACAAAGGTACTIDVVFTSEQTVAAGTSKTYELRATVTSSASTHSIQTVILTDTAVVTGEIEAAGAQIDDLDGTNAATGAYNFIWSDISAIPHNEVDGATADGEDAAASNDWTNGLYVKTLPSDTQTMTKS